MGEESGTSEETEQINQNKDHHESKNNMQNQNRIVKRKEITSKWVRRKTYQRKADEVGCQK